jgi:putative Mg2+ transporter-C (MgtC) family protein
MKMQLTMIFQFLLSLVLGGLLGFEREISYKSAGIRTFAAVCGGACLFGILSCYVAQVTGITAANVTHDPSRIAAQVVTGVGFLGAGLMFREGDATKGLTTAASLWASAAIGLTVAFSLYFVAITATLLLFAILLLSHSKIWLYLSPKRKNH